MKPTQRWISLLLAAAMLFCSASFALGEEDGFAASLTARFAKPGLPFATEVRWWMAEGAHTDETLLEEIQRRKDLISQGIIHILSTQKLQARKCKTCGRNLPWNWPYTMCDGCFRRENIRYGGPRGRRSGHRR